MSGVHGYPMQIQLAPTGGHWQTLAVTGGLCGLADWRTCRQVPGAPGGHWRTGGTGLPGFASHTHGTWRNLLADTGRHWRTLAGLADKLLADCWRPGDLWRTAGDFYWRTGGPGLNSRRPLTLTETIIIYLRNKSALHQDV